MWTSGETSAGEIAYFQRTQRQQAPRVRDEGLTWYLVLILNPGGIIVVPYYV